MFDVQAVAAQFPALLQQINDQRLVYLDSAATTQKPRCVIDAITDYYSHQNANVHRGSHSLTAKATSQFESARQTVADFLGASTSKEIVWTRGATEALNLIAQTYARNTLKPGDEILISEMEHHANIVPWQIVAEQTGAKVVKVPMTDECSFDIAAFKSLLSAQTKIVALAHITNVTGTRQPIEQVIELSHQMGAIVVVDGAQGIVHERVNLASLNADFYVFSGHKLYAPAGIGVLYGKLKLLEAMPPWHGGGKMVEKVSFEGTTYSELPGKFEAGTPNVAGAIALETAINWYQSFDQQAVEAHIHQLVSTAYTRLSALEDIEVFGYQPGASVLSFVMDGVHHQDMATLLDQQGIAVRAGHHCAHPLMDALGVKGTVRASFAIYNTMEDVERFIAAVEKAVDML
ncbi:cysteine desulfurase [Vibrio orientalis CIP 102891 = ATCC 33934]|uniref:Probable cysteine desulfurase n=1 Tax=Vibrio orientalis CIP 102891 = ATCC 33934 TaxID=675816 RepID=C9QMR1_VIBOR|nr:cysteine desulfurase CsdA [Vibrio orientalis]EEX93157.1 cysteine desulfurase [Vibrio orientalis CIP 102891 = ATCC 33934]EGU48099.1 cysteine desulfurase [Vibrio orientalis CIP 102891 = ATCC 33934]